MTYYAVIALIIFTTLLQLHDLFVTRVTVSETKNGRPATLSFCDIVSRSVFHATILLTGTSYAKLVESAIGRINVHYLVITIKL